MNKFRIALNSNLHIAYKTDVFFSLTIEVNPYLHMNGQMPVYMG